MAVSAWKGGTTIKRRGLVLPAILFVVLLASIALLVSRFLGPNPLSPAALRASALGIAAANGDPQPVAVYSISTRQSSFLAALGGRGVPSPSSPPVIGVLMQGHFTLGVGPSAQKTGWLYLTLARAKVYNSRGRLLYDPGQVLSYGPTNSGSLQSLARLGTLRKL